MIQYQHVNSQCRVIELVIYTDVSRPLCLYLYFLFWIFFFAFSFVETTLNIGSSVNWPVYCTFTAFSGIDGLFSKNKNTVCYALMLVAVRYICALLYDQNSPDQIEPAANSFKAWTVFRLPSARKNWWYPPMRMLQFSEKLPRFHM